MTATEIQAGSSAEIALKLGINGQCESLRHSLQVVDEHISRGDSKKREDLKKNGY